MTGIGRSVALAGACLVAFALLTVALIGGPVPWLDEHVRHWAVVHQSPGVRGVAVDARWLGDVRVAGIALLIVTGVVSWRVRRWRLLPLAVGVAALLGLAVEVLKIVIGRSPAPFAAHAVLGTGGHSYPSGHVATGAICWGLIAVIASTHVPRLRVVGTVTATLAVAVESWSVVYGPSHWLTDAVGAVLLSAAALAAFIALDGARLSRRRRS